jgi:hypothetical protein
VGTAKQTPVCTVLTRVRSHTACACAVVDALAAHNGRLGDALSQLFRARYADKLPVPAVELATSSELVLEECVALQVCMALRVMVYVLTRVAGDRWRHVQSTRHSDRHEFISH